MSLLRQLIGVILLVLSLMTITVFVTLQLVAVRPSAEQLATVLADNLRLQLQQHESGAAVVAEPFVLEMRAAPPADSHTLPPLLFNRQLEQGLREQLGDDTRIRMAGQRLWIHAPGLSSHWLGIPFQDNAGDNFLWVVLALLGSFLMAALVGILYARHVTGPLKSLTHLAHRLYRQRDPAPMALKGPMELQTLQQMIQDSAQEAHRLLEDRKLMMVAISHDLRSPMSRIRVAAEMLRDTELRQGIVEDLDEMDHILQQFLCLMRGGEGLPEERVDLRNIVQGCCQSQMRRDRKVECMLPSGPVEMVLPLTLLERVLDNLLNNAWKHGRPPVRVSLEQGAGMALICVRDQGAGIPPEEQTRMLQPFQQAEQARSHGGAGLGLSIVDRFVSMLDGRLSMEQIPNGGFQVCIHLPLQRESGAQATSP